MHHNDAASTQMAVHPRDVLKLVLSRDPAADFASLASAALVLKRKPDMAALVAKANLRMSLGDFADAADAAGKAAMLEPTTDTLYTAAVAKVALALAMCGGIMTGSGTKLPPEGTPILPLIRGAQRNLAQVLDILPDDFDALLLVESLKPFEGQDIDELKARSILGGT